MHRGSHVRVDRGHLYHHGIDLGDGTVIHFTGRLSSTDGVQVQRDTWSDFASGDAIEMVHYGTPTLLPDHTCWIALEQVENTTKRYNLFTNNCEHLARYCKTGVRSSAQVNDTIRRNRQYLAPGILNPGILLALPFVEGAKRMARKGYQHVKEQFAEPIDPPQPLSATRWPLFMMTGRYRWTVDGPLYFQRIDGTYFQDDRIVTAPAESDVVGSARTWRDDAGQGYFESDGRWWSGTPWSYAELAGAGVPEPGWPALEFAPDGALNSLIETPTNMPEFLAAMTQIARRGRGDASTYRILTARAAHRNDDVSGDLRAELDHVRKAALWTLGFIDRHTTGSTHALPSLSVVVALAEDPSEQADVRVAAIQAIQAIERVDDPFLARCVRRLADSSVPEVGEIARLALSTRTG